MNIKLSKPDFRLNVSYAQVGVFDASMEVPFNDWTPECVGQGFSWREKTSFFQTLEEDGPLNVLVKVVNQYEALDTSQRSIRVPFAVPLSGEIEIASISDSHLLTVPTGDYSLYFETWIENGEMWCVFTLSKPFHKNAEILKCDSELSPTYPLNMDAKPA